MINKPVNYRHRPRYKGSRFLYACDNEMAADRYAVFFAGGVALVVWSRATHSAWSTAEAPLPHLTGRRVRWSDLPAAVREHVWERCSELDAEVG